MDARSHDWNDVPERTVGEGVGARTLIGENVVFRWLRLAAGTRIQPHHHPHEQWLHGLSGHTTVECDGVAHELRPGTMLHLPAGTRHGAIAREETIFVEVNMVAGA